MRAETKKELRESCTHINLYSHTLKAELFVDVQLFISFVNIEIYLTYICKQ